MEYGEKVLKIDEKNVTALIGLSRNYSLDSANLDRAVALAQQAMDQIGRMRAQPVPAQYTAAQWKDYLENTEGAARNTLNYAQTIRGH